MNDWISAKSNTGKVAIDPAIGNIRELVFHHDGRELFPLTTAPWVEETDVPETLAPVERSLSGDFLCAPFGSSDIEHGPIHGWAANSSWVTATTLSNQTGAGASSSNMELELHRRIFGATVTKEVWLGDNAPLLYQRHRLVGGEGAITIAHHPMVKLKGRGKFCCSPKVAAISADPPLEANRNRLAAGQESRALTEFPAADGGTLDLTELPLGERHEDFVTLVEEPGRDLGWSAIIREVEDDIVFFLKDPSVLPVTMLWHSNGGRDYAPWNGRHTGVIGIEDGCAAGALGHSAALKQNRFTDFGIPTAVELGGEVTIGHVTGVLPRPSGCNEVLDVNIKNGVVTLTADIGVIAELPIDEGVFS